MSSTEAWLRFARLEIPARRGLTLLEAFGSPEAVLEAKRSDLGEVPGLAARTIDRILEGVPDADVEKDIQAMERCGASLLTISDPDYPNLLRRIPDPPPVLFVRGALQEADRFSVAVVGSRNASHYGMLVAEKISQRLAEFGFTVISGLARGVDSAAHKGALRAGRTVAILGCGVDIAYPPEHRRLMEAIAERGAVVSEAPMRAQPDTWRFPARNRIISGLSLGVVICQSPVNSGAMITADFAVEQGREVFAVPGDVLDPRNGGCHALIRQGAALVERAEDVLAVLGVPVDKAEARQPAVSPQLTLDESRLLELLSL
ncbi:MAG: DNA-processing protein DprA, partial [Armatimonadota bacterium]